MKCSVIMSVFNREDYIKDCIDSIINQSFKDFEVLIIDDCSTDRTVDIIESYCDERIHVYRNLETKGLTKNLNYALSISKGEYIIRMDDDDICLPYRFENEVNFLENNPTIDIVFTKCRNFGANEKYSLFSINNNDFIKSQLCLQNIIYHSSVAFRKKTSIYYDETFIKSQDFELWTRMIFTDIKFGYIKKNLLMYRIHRSQTNKKIQNDCALKILSRNYNSFGLKDDRLFRIHSSILGYSNDIISYDDIKYFYKNFNISSLKRIRINKILFLISYAKSKGIKVPYLFFKLFCCLFNPYNSIILFLFLNNRRKK